MTTPTKILTEEFIQEAAHRSCLKYTHSDDIDFRRYEFGKLTLIGFARAIEQAVLQSPEVVAWKKDAGRYRWLRNESWAGYNQSRRKPQVAETIVFVQDGAGNVKTILAEEALDAAIDAAIQEQKP